MYLTGNLSRAGRSTFDNNFSIRSSGYSAGVQSLTLFLSARPNCFRTCLQDPNLVRPAVDAPFNIHIATIVSFNLLRITCQFQNLSICQSLNLAFLGRNRLFLTIAAFFTDKHYILFINLFVHNLHVSLGNSIMIGGNSSLDHIFTQAKGTFDNDIGVITGSHIHREHNTGSLGKDHHLNDGA